MIRRAPHTHAGTRGFTIIEVIVSAVVLGFLSAGALTALSSTAKAQQLSADRARARFLADALIAEIGQQAYVEGSNYGAVLGPESGEVSGASRALFDDLDDYNSLSEAPPKTRDGKDIAGLAGWTRQTRVNWVTTANTAASSATETYLKKVTVTVSKKGRALATAVALRSASTDKGRSVRKSVVSSQNAVASMDAKP